MTVTRSSRIYMGGTVVGDLDLSGNLSLSDSSSQKGFFGDDDYTVFGNTAASPDASIGWNTSQTVDGLFIGLATGQNTLIIAEEGDKAYDFAHGAQSIPTLFIQSSNQSATEFGKYTAGKVAWGLPLAVSATEYSIGRDADGTNQLHLNAPSGAGYEFSIADTAFWTIDSLGGITSAVTRTDTGATSPTPNNWIITFDPAGASSTIMHGNFFKTETASGNAQTFTRITGGLFNARHRGTNTLDLAVAASASNSNSSTGTITLSEAYRIATPVNSGGGTIVTNYGVHILDQSLAGMTTSHALIIDSQTANATTTRAIELAGTGVNNAIRLGASANMYANATNNIRIMDSTNARGLDFNLTAAGDQQINTTSTTGGSLVFQQATFTSGALFTAQYSAPTFASENFTHRSYGILATQNGANTETLVGLYVVLTKATGATTLGGMQGIYIDAPVVAGTVTASYAIDVVNQGTAGITTPRFLRTQSGVANAWVVGASPLIYSSGAEVIDFYDSTNARGLIFTMTAAGNQTIATSAGDLALASKTIMSGARFQDSQGADIASANDLTLGIANCWEITGAVQINDITYTDWQNGSLITLFFTSTPTVKHNGSDGAGTVGANTYPILLAGSADFAATAGDQLTLRLSEIGGVNAWREISRTAI